MKRLNWRRESERLMAAFDAATLGSEAREQAWKKLLAATDAELARRAELRVRTTVAGSR
jgi:hypothetical protein